MGQEKERRAPLEHVPRRMPPRDVHPEYPEVAHLDKTGEPIRKAGGSTSAL